MTIIGKMTEFLAVYILLVDRLIENVGNIGYQKNFLKTDYFITL